MRLMVPSPLFMSWPDQHFHTQFLTAEKVDPAVLKRCGEVTTSVALMIANAGIKEARYIAKIVETKGISRFMNVSTQTFSEMMDAITNSTDPMVRLNEISKHRKGEIDYLADRSIGALESIKKLEEDIDLHADLAEHREKILKAKKSEKEKIEDYKQLLLKEVQ
jgi:hypothetical protein